MPNHLYSTHRNRPINQTDSLELFENPHSLKSCMHHFCKECIREAIANSSFCPLCKLPAQPREIIPSPVVANIVAHFKRLRAAQKDMVADAQKADKGLKDVWEL